MLFALKRVKYSITAELFKQKGSNCWAVCPEMSLLRVSAKLFSLKESARRAVCIKKGLLQCASRAFALKESASRAVCAEMSLLQCTSQAVCTERKHQPSCLRWDEFTTVYQPSYLHWKKAPAELFAREQHQPNCLHWEMFTTVYQPSCLRCKKTPAEMFCAVLLRWVYYNVPSGLLALKEKVLSSCLHNDEFTNVSQPICFH